MREAFRPYCKTVTLTDQTRVSIPLRDSGGNPLECNYVQVTAVSGNDAEDGFFAVSPPLTNLDEAVGDFPAASGILAHGTASGTCAQLGNIGTGSVTLSLNSPDTVSAIYLSHTTSTPVVYIINYGVVHLTNNIKDSTSSRGN